MSLALAIRHVAFEDLGSLEPVLSARGFAVEYVEAPTAAFERLDALKPELLVVLGGPMGVYDDGAYPFLLREVRLLEQRLAADRPTLGICLGAQLLARALGAQVFPGPVKEIGWAPVSLTEAGRGSVLAPLAQPQTPVLHWHGDTFDLPEGATRLASTESYPNQAFSRGAALGVQFHVEVTETGLEAWYVGHAVEIAATADLSVEGLRAEAARFAPALEAQGQRVFHQWLDRVGPFRG